MTDTRRYSPRMLYPDLFVVPMNTASVSCAGSSSVGLPGDADCWAVVAAEPGDADLSEARWSYGHVPTARLAELETWPLRDAADELFRIVDEAKAPRFKDWDAAMEAAVQG